MRDVGDAGGSSFGGRHRRTRRQFLKQTIYVAAGTAGAVSLLGLADPIIAGSRAPVVFDVTAAPFRARGDGIHDDRPAIQAAIDAAHEAGAGIVWLPAGSYLLDSVQEEPGWRYYLLDMRSAVSLEGAGIGRTILTAGAGMPDQTRIISTDGKVHVTRISFTDFTIDGNAADQPNAASMVGIQCGATVGAVHERVLIHDVKGTASGEGALFDSYGATDSLYIDCEAARSGQGSTSSGFSATLARNISYVDCKASGSTHWQGFTTYLSQGIRYLRCHGFGNGQRGLNCEESSSVSYTDCAAGGPGQGNRGDGFCLYKSSDVTLNGCRSFGNLNGMINNGSGAVRVNGGEFSQNRAAGLAFVSAADRAGTEIIVSPDVLENQRGAIAVAGRFDSLLS